MDPTATPLTLADPRLAGPLAVFPVFGPVPTLAYRAFADAAAHGAVVMELAAAASVNRLLVRNPTDLPLLLYEGEQVQGAQQDRALDASVLVGAGAEAQVPVSCVEQGRWDTTRRHESFKPAPYADDPSLRRLKRESSLHSAEQGLAGRPAQGAVWQEVGSRLRRFAVASESSRFGDLFEQRRGEIGAFADAVEPAAGQVGALACVGGAPVALDVVSRPEAFAALHDRLVRGYALEALAALDGHGPEGVAPPGWWPDADPAAARTFLARALTAARRPLPTPGMGEAHALVAPRLVGGALTCEGELIALSAFPRGRRAPGGA